MRRRYRRRSRADHRPPPLPLFYSTLARLSLPLAPLVSLSTGASHPSFPRTLLHYHLLTATQLDELAHFYHQRTPGPFTDMYPVGEGGCRWRRDAELGTKRRKFGRFVGLRGCETPVEVGRRERSAGKAVLGGCGMEWSRKWM